MVIIMHNFRTLRLVALGALLCLLLLTMTACSSVESMTDLSTAEAFLDCVLADRYDDAYAMLSGTVSEADFAPVWQDLRTLTEGATAYELDAESLKETTSLPDGKTVIEQTFIVTLNNRRTFTYRVAMHEGAKGLIGMHYRDVTDFVTATDRCLPTCNLLLGVVSIGFLAFRIWMLVDCIRRKLARNHVLWILAILLGVSLMLTVGDTFGIRFGLAVPFDRMSLAADPLLYALTITLSFPVGAFVYFLNRKKLPLREPPAVDGEE